MSVTQKICIIDECSSTGCIDKRTGKPSLRKGMCNKHYIRTYRHGDAHHKRLYLKSRQSSSLKKYKYNRHELLATYYGILSRCNNLNDPAYKYYGGRGIKVCERWHSFANFLEDMGERPEGYSIDRINNDGDYEPSNCRWATRKIQSINKRVYSNNKSGVKGVHWYNKTNKWRARIVLDGVTISLGLYDDIQSAKDARIIAENKYHLPILS